MEDSTVVSEIGEQWSPKIPPDNTRPIAGAIGAPIAAAKGMEIGRLIINNVLTTKGIIGIVGMNISFPLMVE